MPWSDQLNALNAAALAPEAFGEPMILPTGSVTLCAFDPQGQAVTPLRSNVGQGWNIQAEPNPTADILTTAAPAVAVNQTVLLRGQRYRVVSLLPDGSGITTVTLMPAAPVDPLARWQ